MTGSGTQADPYIIGNVTDLQNMENVLTAYYELGGNIDASATSTWNGGLGFNPISNFTGQLDGKGYSITSLTINRPLESGTGLFDTCTGATVKNLIISGGSITGYQNVGALVGNAFTATVIDNCSSSASVAGWRQVGGLLGRVGNYPGASEVNSITDSYSTGAVSIVTTYGTPRYIGGFVGWARATGSLFTDCYATGSISGSTNSTSNVGGFVGYVEEAVTFTSCYATGNITLTGTSCSGGGGFIGICWGGTYSKCYATGAVSIAGASSLTGGGFAGEIYGNVAVTVTDCYARGAATVATQNVGGFMGYAEAGLGATISRAYSTGAVSGTSDKGGFCGENLDATPATITNCFWDTQTSGTATSDGGTGKTTAQMKTKSTFTDAGWSFVIIWHIDGVTNNGYPFLRAAAVYPTDPLTRVSGITRQFWAGKGGNAVYDMQITTGGVSTAYIPPVGTRQEIAAVPQEISAVPQEISVTPAQAISQAFIDAVNQARGITQTSPGIPGVPNPLPGTPGNIGNPPGTSPFVTGSTTPFQVTPPTLYLDPKTGKLTRKKPQP